LRESNSSWLSNDGVIALVKDMTYLESLIASREKLM
jgi:hypothetical protein